MRKIIYFLLLLITLPGFSKTYLDYFYRIDGFYTNAKFTDENKVVLVGSSGKVLFSLDNGSSWYSNYTNTSETLFDCEKEPNTKSIFCVGENGIVIKTTNLGKSWERVNINSNFNLNSISFSKKVGFIATSNGMIYKSTDSGNNWIKLETIKSFSFKLIKIAKNGSIIAIDNNCRIFISKDNGDNWDSINYSNEIVDANCGGLSINNDLMVIYTNMGLLVSYDSGNSWAFKEILYKEIVGLSITNKYQVRAVCRIRDDGSLYRYFDMLDINFENEVKITKVENSLDKNYLLYKSTPMGFASNEFSQAHESLVYGTLNSIMMSFDNLQTWQAKSYLNSSSYYTLFALNSDTLFAGTDRNNIFHSYNGGATWLPQKDSSGLISPYTIGSLYFSDGMNGIAFQNNGYTKMFTNNGGLTFDTISQNGIKPKVSSIKDTLTYCLISDYISILTQFTNISVTTDGGKNYNQTLLEYTDYPISIAPFIFLENGKMISIARKIDSVDQVTKKRFYIYSYLSTDDYGKTWNWELIKNLDKPYSLNIINDSLAFIKTSYEDDSTNFHYFLYKSVDNLKTWKVVIETPTGMSASMQLKDGKGIINGAYGEIYQTKDYGDTWEPLIDTLVINSNTGLLHKTDKAYFLTAIRGLYKSIPDSMGVLTDVRENIESTEISPSQIWLYAPNPNPVKKKHSFDMIWVKSINEDDIKIEISDLNGNILSDVSNSPRSYLLENKVKISIDVKSLNSGVYYLSASTKDYKRTISFVVVR